MSYKILKHCYKPNLLVNGDFLVNQRGNSSYSHALASRLYTLDMWCLYSNVSTTAKIEVLGTGGVKYSTSGTESQFFQDLQNQLPQGDYTLMIKVKSMNTVSGTGTNYVAYYNGSTIIKKAISSTGITTLDIKNDKVSRVYVLGNISSFVEIEYIGLYEGIEVAKHQKEDYASAFVRCLKYVRTLTYDMAKYGVASQGLKDTFAFEIKMLSAPNVTVLSLGSSTNVNNASVSASIDRIVLTTIPKATGMTTIANKKYLISCEPL